MVTRPCGGRGPNSSECGAVPTAGDHEYDVAIVGASLAGCTAATFLGRAGARVALIESHADPASYKRMCTHVIQASASPTLARLGILAELKRPAPGRAASASGAATAGSNRRAPTWSGSARREPGST